MSLRGLVRHPIHLDWLATAVADWLMWQFVRLVRRGQRYEMAGNAVIVELRRRDGAMGDPSPVGSVVDMTADSEVHAWRPRLKLEGGWVQPRANARMRPPKSGCRHRESRAATGYRGFRQWGPARLSTQRG